MLRKQNPILFCCAFGCMLVWAFLACTKHSPQSVLTKGVFASDVLQKEFPFHYGKNYIYAPFLTKQYDYCYYAVEEAGNYDIRRINTITLKEESLTISPAFDSYPSLSDSSRYLVFASARDDAMGDIYLCDLGTVAARLNEMTGRIPMHEVVENNLVRITDFRGKDAEPRISHDGKHIAFVSYRTDSMPYIFLASRRPRSARQLSDIIGANPSFSFDDKKVIFVSYAPGSRYSQIARIALDGEEARILTKTKTFKFAPVYYNKRTIVYYEISKDRNGDARLTIADGVDQIAYDTVDTHLYTIRTNVKDMFHHFPEADAQAMVYLKKEDDAQNAFLSSTASLAVKEESPEAQYQKIREIAYPYKTEAYKTLCRLYPRAYAAQAESLFYLYIQHRYHTNRSEAETVREAGLSNVYRNTPQYTFFRMLSTTNYARAAAMAETLTPPKQNYAYYFLADRYVHETSDFRASAYPLLAENVRATIIGTNLYMRSAYLMNEAVYHADFFIDSEYLMHAQKSTHIGYAEKYAIARDYVRRYTIGFEKENYEILITNVSAIYGRHSPFELAALAEYLASRESEGQLELVRTLLPSYLESETPSASFLANYLKGRVLRSEKMRGWDKCYRFAFHKGAAFRHTEIFKHIQRTLGAYIKKNAEAYYARAAYEKAFHAYQELVRVHPEDTDAQLRFVELSFMLYTDNLKAIEDMIALKEAATGDDYTDARSHLQLAYAYFYAGRYYYQQGLDARTNIANRFMMRNHKRIDRYQDAMRMAYRYFTKKALPEINLAVFLAPDDMNYYFAKYKMLAYIQTLQTRYRYESEDAGEMLPADFSLEDVLPYYTEEERKAPTALPEIHEVAIEGGDYADEIINTLKRLRRLPQIAAREESRVLVDIGLGNAYADIGAYLEATEYYAYAREGAGRVLNRKERAWFNFLYGYALWNVGDESAARVRYERALEAFARLDDISGLYRLRGYMAILALNEKNYYEAMRYLKQRLAMKTRFSIDDNPYIDELLIATSYARLGQYGEAKRVCDRIQAGVRALDSSAYRADDIHVYFLGADIALSSTIAGLHKQFVQGGKIPSYPLNIDKQQMLNSLYIEIYAHDGRVAKAREVIALQRELVKQDVLKDKALFSATLINNEAVLLFDEGAYDASLKGFYESIEHYRESLPTVTKKTEAEQAKADETRQMKNIAHDIINYLNISYIYLRAASEKIELEGVDLRERLHAMRDFFEYALTYPMTPKSYYGKIYSRLAALNYYLARLSRSEAEGGFEGYLADEKRVGYIAEAIRYYKRILDRDGLDPLYYITSHENIGRVYLFAGDTRRAHEAFIEGYNLARRLNMPRYRYQSAFSLAKFLSENDVAGVFEADAIERYLGELAGYIRDDFFCELLRGKRPVDVEELREFAYAYYTEAGDYDRAIDFVLACDILFYKKALLDEQRKTGDPSLAKALRMFYEKASEHGALATTRTELAQSAEYPKNAERIIAQMKRVEAETRGIISEDAGDYEALFFNELSMSQYANRLPSDERIIYAGLRLSLLVYDGEVSLFSNAFDEGLSQTNETEAHAAHEFFGLTTRVGGLPFPEGDRSLRRVRAVESLAAFFAFPPYQYRNAAILLPSEALSAFEADYSNEEPSFQGGGEDAYAIQTYTNPEHFQSEAQYAEYIDIYGMEKDYVEALVSKTNLYVLVADTTLYLSNKAAFDTLDYYTLFVCDDEATRMNLFEAFRARGRSESLKTLVRSLSNDAYVCYGKYTLSPSTIETRYQETLHRYRARFQDTLSTNIRYARDLAYEAVRTAYRSDEKLTLYATFSSEMLRVGETNAAISLAYEGVEGFVGSGAEDFATNDFVTMLFTYAEHSSTNTSREHANVMLLASLATNQYSFLTNTFIPGYLSQRRIETYYQNETVYLKRKAYLETAEQLLGEHERADFVAAIRLVDATLREVDLEPSHQEAALGEEREALHEAVQRLYADLTTLSTNDIYEAIDLVFARQYTLRDDDKERLVAKITSELMRHTPALLYAFLEKKDFETSSPLLERANEIDDVLGVMETNAALIYYTRRGARYYAYPYDIASARLAEYALVGDVSMEEERGALESTTNTEARNEHLNRLSEMMYAPFAESLVAHRTLYVLGTPEVYEIPFAFFPFDGRYLFETKNIVKLRRLERGPAFTPRRAARYQGRRSATNAYARTLEYDAVYRNLDDSEAAMITHDIRGESGAYDFTGDVFFSPVPEGAIRQYVLAAETPARFLYANRFVDTATYAIMVKGLYEGLDDLPRAYAEHRRRLYTRFGDIHGLYPFDYVLPYYVARVEVPEGDKGGAHDDGAERKTSAESE